jgi:hypothetical protein
MEKELYEALERMMGYARAYKDGSDWLMVREWLDEVKETNNF